MRGADVDVHRFTCEMITSTASRYALARKPLSPRARGWCHLVWPPSVTTSADYIPVVSAVGGC